jgi:hypothetical protein
VGTATGESFDNADGSLRIVGTTVNAPWYAALYTIDDRVESTWIPGERSLGYITQFREGGFRQDQVMDLDPAGFVVWRRQYKDGEWREWSTPYDGHPAVEDPVSAIYRARGMEGEGPWTFPVFSGDKTWTLRVLPLGSEPLKNAYFGRIQTRRFELETAHKGEVEQRGRFFVWVTDDPFRVPVRVVIQSSVGPIRADLVDYRPPSDH